MATNKCGDADGTMKKNRSRLCKIIASLPPTATREDATKILQPIINRSRSPPDESDTRSTCSPSDDEEEDVDGITPLMVACDKAQLAVLQYLEEEIRSDVSKLELVGHPLDASCAKCGGNTAGHHAASIGFTEGIEWLVKMMMLTEAKTDIDPEQRHISEQYSYARWLLHLLSQRNENGDTPCMMAAASGQESVIRNWIRTLRGSYVDDDGVSSSEVRRLFETSNCCGDTVCSLACGHGFYSIVSLMIEPTSTSSEGNGIIAATHSDLEKCRASLARMDSLMPMVKKKGNQKEQEDFISRRQNTQRCIDVLETACDRLAQKNMHELLLGATDVKQTDAAKKSKTKQGHKRDKRNRQKKTKKKNTPGTAVSADKEHHADNTSTHANETSQTDGNVWKISAREQQLQKLSNGPETLTSPRVVTLQDGTVISTSTSERTTYAAEEEECLRPIVHEDNSDMKATAEKSIDDMLRDRCSERRVQSEVEAIMDSLCLDTSMLLLTSHGMALDLSPCQLDAVESILNTQLGAIHEARKIQARIRTQSKTGTIM